MKTISKKEEEELGMKAINASFLLFTMLLISPEWFKFLRDAGMTTKPGEITNMIGKNERRIRNFYLVNIYPLTKRNRRRGKI